MLTSFRLAVLPVALAASPALAEPPRISLIFGADHITAQPEDILSVDRIDQAGRGAALVIRLHTSFNAQMRELTKAHVGQTGQLLICGLVAIEPFLNEPIYEAVFTISDPDPAHIDRLETLLTGPHCDEVPES